MEYSQWRRFREVIEKAKIACKNSEYNVLDHFAEVGKMVSIDSLEKRKQKELMNVFLEITSSFLRDFVLK